MSDQDTATTTIEKYLEFALIALAASLWSRSALFGEIDNDLWMHVQTGMKMIAEGALPTVDSQSFTARGSRWIDHEWLVQVFAGGVFETLGNRGLFLVRAGCVLSIGGLLWSTSRAQASPAASALATLLAGSVVARGLAPRPQLFSYLAIAGLLWLLGRRNSLRIRDCALLALVFVVWANAHGALLVGIGVALLVAFDPRREEGSKARIGLSLLPLALLATPYFLEYPRYLAYELSTPHPLSEWRPILDVPAEHVAFFALLGVVAISLGKLWWKREMWRAAALAVVTILAFRHQRHAPIVALVACAPLALGFDVILARLRGALSPSSLGAIALCSAVMAIALAAQAIFDVSVNRARPYYRNSEYPGAVVPYLDRVEGPIKILAPLDWGNFLLWHAQGKVEVALDGRFAQVFPAAVTEEVFDALAFPKSMRAFVDRHGVDALLVPPGGASSFRSNPAWERCFADDAAELLWRGKCPKPAKPAPAAFGTTPFPGP